MRIGLRKARAMCPWSSVEAAYQNPEVKSTFFSPAEKWCLPSPSENIGGNRNCCRLRSVDAHDQQKRFAFHRIEDRENFEESDDGHNSQWRSADTWRDISLRQKNWIYSWHWKSSKIRQRCCCSESFARVTDIHMSAPMIEDHVSLKTVITYNVIRKTTYRSKSPSLSTTSSSSSSSDSSPPTPSSQERTGSKT